MPRDALTGRLLSAAILAGALGGSIVGALGGHDEERRLTLDDVERRFRRPAAVSDNY